MTDILLATYNGEKFIREQLESLLIQTCGDFRIVIRDDASTDSTCEIIREIINDNKDREIVLLSDKGASGSAKNNFMRLIKCSDADYVMFCDQDDIWEPDKVKESIKAILKMENKFGKDMPLMVHTDLAVMSEEGKIISDSLIEYMNLPRKDSLKNILLQNSVTGCTVIINKALLTLLKRADENEKIVMHDHFAACLAALFGHVGLLNKPTVCYRQHGDNEIGAQNAKSLRYMLHRFHEGKKNFRSGMEANYRQAEYIVSLYKEELKKVDEKKRAFLEEYAGLLYKSSHERRVFFKKYNMYKYGKLKKLMQIFWC